MNLCGFVISWHNSLPYECIGGNSCAGTYCNRTALVILYVFCIWRASFLSTVSAHVSTLGISPLLYHSVFLPRVVFCWTITANDRSWGLSPFLLTFSVNFFLIPCFLLFWFFFLNSFWWLLLAWREVADVLLTLISPGYAVTFLPLAS